MLSSQKITLILRFESSHSNDVVSAAAVLSIMIILFRQADTSSCFTPHHQIAQLELKFAGSEMQTVRQLMISSL